MNLSKFRINRINLSDRKKYYFVYTVLFALTAFLVFFWFFTADRTFIWRLDGWQQHYKALIYYSKYLRSIIKNLLLQHKLIIPNWDFNIGSGSDILSTLHYYTIGDPLSVFSIFFSEDNMYLYYDAAIILRMYLAGIVFSVLCFETDIENKYAVLAGAMAYSFCGWAIFAKQHPFFINPMIYFPLLIIGIEKIIKKKRAYTFIAAVAISALCNSYFFYMLVLTVIIYTVFRTILLYRKNIKNAALLIVRIGLSSILGLMLSAVISLPLFYVFINDTRVSESLNLHLLYPLSYYSALPQLFISSGNEYYLSIGLSAPILLAVFLMFYKKKQYKLPKTLLITCVIMTLFPVFGQIFNGFSYIANRWSWAFTLLCSYILALLWSSLMNLDAKEGRFIFRCTVIYSIICMLCEYSQGKKAFVSLSIAFILLIILIPSSDKEILISYKRKQRLTLLIVVVSIIINSHWGNSYFDNSDGAAYLEVRQLALDANETTAVSEIASLQGIDEFYRYSGRELTENASMLASLSSTEYYWSLSNPNIPEYRKNFDIFENRSFDPSNYDDRAGLTSLASVLYYVTPANDSAPAPYGFTYIDNPEGQSAYKVYRNEYALPLSYTYYSYMTEDFWNALSPIEKEESMLQSVVLSESPLYTTESQPTLSSYEIPYTITCNSDDVTIENNTFITTAENAAATISFDAEPNSEVFIYFEGLNFTETPLYDLYYGNPSLDPLDLYNYERWDYLDQYTQQKIKKDKLYWSKLEHDKTSLYMSTKNNEYKTLHYFTKDYEFYGGRHDFAGNFLSLEDGLSSIDISFYLRGVYSFDSLKIICQPMDNYADQIEALRENTLQNVNIGTDTLSGNITLDKPGLLCFSIPYSIGWSAYVDGEKAKLYQANIMHMALDLESGDHEIILVYRTPFLKEGIYISLFASALFIILIIVNERRQRKINQK